MKTTKILAVVICNRIGTGYLVVGQVVHKIEVVLHFLKGVMLENGEYVAFIVIILSIYKVVGIFDTVTDALVISQFPDRVICQKIFKLIAFNGGVNRHKEGKT